MRAKYSARLQSLLDEMEELINAYKVGKKNPENDYRPYAIALNREQWEIFTKEYGGRNNYRSIPVKRAA